MSHIVEPGMRPAPTVDFAKVGAQAIASMEQTPAAPVGSGQVPATPATPPPAAAVSGNADPAQAVVTDPNPGVPASPDKVYTIEFPDGKTEQVTAAQLKEWRDGGLRLADYTRKTTEVARQREEIDRLMPQLQSMQEDLKVVQALKQNPELIVSLAQRYVAEQQANGQLPGGDPRGGFDPNAPVTAGQIAHMVQAMAERMQQIEQGSADNINRVVQDRLQVQSFAQTVDRTIADVFAKHPILSAIPENEDIIRYRVAQMRPQTLEEAVQRFQEVGEVLANDLLAKAGVAQQTQHNQQIHQRILGTEPPRVGAVPPLATTTQPGDYVKNGQLDWAKLRGAALGYVQDQRTQS